MAKALSALIIVAGLGLTGCFASNEISDPDGDGKSEAAATASGTGGAGSESSNGGPSGGPSRATSGGPTAGSTAETTSTSTSGIGGSESSTTASSDTGGGQAGTSTTAAMIPEGDYCAPTADWDPAWAALEQEILELVNQYRAEGATCGGEVFGPAGPLQMDASLQCAARMHSLDMDQRDFFSHDNPSGEGPSERMEKAGYDGRGWGENIAGGNSTAAETMEQWMDSPGHCSNIMSPGYTLIGVGYHPGGEWGHLWTQTFGG